MIMEIHSKNVFNDIQLKLQHKEMRILKDTQKVSLMYSVFRKPPFLIKFKVNTDALKCFLFRLVDLD